MAKIIRMDGQLGGTPETDEITAPSDDRVTYHDQPSCPLRVKCMTHSVTDCVLLIHRLRQGGWRVTDEF